jgi:hypothetical protein
MTIGEGIGQLWVDASSSMMAFPEFWEVLAVPAVLASSG